MIAIFSTSRTTGEAVQPARSPGQCVLEGDVLESLVVFKESSREGPKVQEPGDHYQVDAH
jgi:hypothetical protein